MKSYPPMAALSALSNADRDCPCSLQNPGGGQRVRAIFRRFSRRKSERTCAARERKSILFSPRWISPAESIDFSLRNRLDLPRIFLFRFFPPPDGRQLCCVRAINSIKIVGSCFFFCFSKKKVESYCVFECLEGSSERFLELLKSLTLVFIFKKVARINSFLEKFRLPI